MTEEERQRQMDFIIAQQAQFAANQQMAEERQRMAEERQRMAEERIARVDERWASTEEGIRALLAIAEIHEREIMTISETASQNARATDERLRATDERLNALINVVERIISERRNGQA
jgi:DNA-binding protein H-NS